MNVIEFNYHAKRAHDNPDSVDVIYFYCVDIIRERLRFRFGKKFFDTNAPHDIFTKMFIEKTPKNFIVSPKAYLCKAADHYALSLLRKKDNCTVELLEEYSYTQDYSSDLEFESKEMEDAWNSLDEITQFIIFWNYFHDYPLFELAEILGKSYDCVRTKKSRGMKILKEVAKKNEIKRVRGKI